MRRRSGVADASRIVFTLNATAALNLAIQGAGLRASDVMVTALPSTTPSSVRPRSCVWNRDDVEIVGLSQNGSLDEDCFRRARFARRPRLVALTHASNVTGRVFPIARIFRAAKVRCVDGPGRIAVTWPHTYVTRGVERGHSGLHRSQGSARTGRRRRTVYCSRNRSRTDAGGRNGSTQRSQRTPARDAQQAGSGQHNLPGLAGLAAALEWLERDGQDTAALAACRGASLRHELAHIPGIEIFDGECDCERIGVISIRIGGWDIGEAGTVLNQSFEMPAAPVCTALR